MPSCHGNRPGALTMPVIVKSILLAAGLGLVAGLLPAWRVRRLHPVTVHLLWCHYVAPHHETAHALVVSFHVHWREDEFRVDGFIALQACSTSMVRTPVPEDLQDDVAVLGCDDFRIWAHEPLRDIERLLLENRKQQVAGGMMYDENGEVRDANALAISGGGDNGAFSAGVLSGWSEL